MCIRDRCVREAAPCTAACRQNEGGRDTLEVKVEIVPLISVAVTRVSLIRVACGVSLIRVGDSALGRDALELLAVAAS
eukprot:3598991-Pleurochrysis_carterae.AAC.1